MKIQDIIAPRNDLNEAIPGAGIAGKILGGVANIGAKLLGKGLRSQSIDKLGQALANLGHPTTRILAPDKIAAIAQHLQIDNKFIQSPKFLQAAEKRAVKFAQSATLAANLAAVKAQLAAASKGIQWLTNLGLGATYMYYIGNPFYKYYNAVDQAADAVKTGDMTPDEFELHRKKLASVLVGEIAGVLVSGKLARGGINKLTKFFAVGPLSFMAPLVAKLSVPAQIYVMNAFKDSDIADAIATVMSSKIMTGSAGTLSTAAIDKIKSILGQADTVEKVAATAPAGTTPLSRPAKSQPNDATTIPGTTSAPQSGQVTSPDTTVTPQAAPYNPAEWEYSSPGIVKNIKTGQVAFAPQP